MKKIIYIENEIRDCPRVRSILNKFKKKEVIFINRYTEVFNKKNQSFRMQKTNQAVILAKKHANFINETPKKYTIGNKKNYYFSYMYNCLFDCKYCFLQGLYSSSNFVIFINYEDFFDTIQQKVYELKNTKSTFFSGYDCDSLVYDQKTSFIDKAIDFFSNINGAELEIRTKSNYIKPLMRQSVENVIIAFSFTPIRFSKIYERGVPDLQKRINAIKRIISRGWKIGLRFDPFIIYEDCERDYKELFNILSENIPKEYIHSITYGNLRFPINIFKRIEKENVKEKLFLNLDKDDKFIQQKDKRFISDFCYKNIPILAKRNLIFSNL